MSHEHKEMERQRVCSDCGGSGEGRDGFEFPVRCQRCHGTGKLHERAVVDENTPPFMTNEGMVQEERRVGTDRRKLNKTREKLNALLIHQNKADRRGGKI
jgi:DnaJ-class molecular chaperone